VVLPVVYRAKVGRDLASAFDYYERQVEGLGEQFLRAVDSAFDAIERYPEMFVRVHGEVRRALVSRFPYAVFYTIETRSIVVLTVLHTARDPRLWPRSQRNLR
jgi:plasmid stabilization system protein ParE